MAVLAPDVTQSELFPALVGQRFANHLGPGARWGEADAGCQQAGQHRAGVEAGGVEAVRSYQDLWQVQAAFRTMKNVLELRPAWHHAEERVQAHLQVAFLELTIDRVWSGSCGRRGCS